MNLDEFVHESSHLLIVSAVDLVLPNLVWVR